MSDYPDDDHDDDHDVFEDHDHDDHEEHNHHFIADLLVDLMKTIKADQGKAPAARALVASKTSSASGRAGPPSTVFTKDANGFKSPLSVKSDTATHLPLASRTPPRNGSTPTAIGVVMETHTSPPAATACCDLFTRQLAASAEQMAKQLEKNRVTREKMEQERAQLIASIQSMAAQFKQEVVKQAEGAPKTSTTTAPTTGGK